MDHSETLTAAPPTPNSPDNVQVAAQQPKKDFRKSRGGCSRCKFRRVKCDERRPCKNCIRRNENCDLLLPESIRSRSKCSTCAGAESPMEWARDAYLMHHYSTETAFSIMNVPDIQKLFQIQVPEFALAEPHLLRGLMSLSAFHLAYKRPAEEQIWMPLAFKHHTAITRSLRQLIDNVTPANCIPVFCLSIIVSMTALVGSNWSPPITPGGPPDISELFQPLILIRGTSSIFKYGQEIKLVFEHGPLAVFIAGYFIEGADARDYLDVSTLEHFENIRKMIETNYEPGALQEQMLFAHDWLVTIYAEVGCTQGTANGNTCLVWKWLSLIGDAFVVALKALDEGVILVFAHFAILSKVYKGYWYLEGWPDRVIAAASSFIRHPEYIDALNWAVMQSKNDMPVFKLARRQAVILSLQDPEPEPVD